MKKQARPAANLPPPISSGQAPITAAARKAKGVMEAKPAIPATQLKLTQTENKNPLKPKKAAKPVSATATVKVTATATGGEKKVARIRNSAPAKPSDTAPTQEPASPTAADKIKADAEAKIAADNAAAKAKADAEAAAKNNTAVVVNRWGWLQKIALPAGWIIGLLLAISAIVLVVKRVNVPVVAVDNEPLRKEIADLHKVVGNLSQELTNRLVIAQGEQTPKSNAPAGWNVEVTDNHGTIQNAGRDIINYGYGQTDAIKHSTPPCEESEVLPHGCRRKVEITLTPDELKNKTYGVVRSLIEQGDYVVAKLPEGNEGWNMSWVVTPIANVNIWRDGNSYHVVPNQPYDPRTDTTTVRKYEFVLKPDATSAELVVTFSR